MGQAAKITLNILLGFLPDLAIAWAISRFTESGQQGFWYTLLALQVLYLLLWIKTVGWSWVVFWVFGREQMAGVIQKYLTEINSRSLTSMCSTWKTTSTASLRMS